MEVPGLTRENVASHLQKYRLYLKKMQSHSHSGSAVPKPKSNTVWGLKPSKEATAEWERPRGEDETTTCEGEAPRTSDVSSTMLSDRHKSHKYDTLHT